VADLWSTALNEKTASSKNHGVLQHQRPNNGHNNDRAMCSQRRFFDLFPNGNGEQRQTTTTEKQGISILA